MSETNTNFRDTSWRKDSLQLSGPHKTRWQVSLKKTGEHFSPASLGVFGIWLVFVRMCTVLRPERKRAEKDSSETPPPGLCDDISEGHLQPLRPHAHPQLDRQHRGPRMRLGLGSSSPSRWTSPPGFLGWSSAPAQCRQRLQAKGGQRAVQIVWLQMRGKLLQGPDVPVTL